MTRFEKSLGCPAAAACWLLLAAAGNAQQPPADRASALQRPAIEWVQTAVNQEIGSMQQQGTFSVRYRERRIDAKGDTTREIIESRQGGVARLLERDGRPITPAEDAAERARLNDTLAHPDDFLKHHRRDKDSRDDGIALLRLMPQAMLHTYTPGQPQLPELAAPQVVIDFQPNPQFHPPTLLAELLTGVAGRVWIDQATGHVVRMEARILRPVNFGFGILARVYPGGTVAAQEVQTDGHWFSAQVEEHVTVRVVVKTLPQNLRIHSSGYQVLPAPLPFQDAIHLLLAMPVVLRP